MVIINAPFFTSVRRDLFNGRLSTPQVTGMQAIVAAWNEMYPTDDPRKLAYCLATAFHETAQTMQPIEEYGKGRGRQYGIPDKRTGKTYYGRGYVQLTWLVNYIKMGQLLNVDLAGHPERALKPDLAAKIMFHGMTDGVFTGKKLADYFSGDKVDPVNARRIVNGTDRADDIAKYYSDFVTALHAT